MRVLIATLLVGLAASCGYSVKFTPANLATGTRMIDYRLDWEVMQARNGLTIVHLPEPKTNLVKVDVRYQVGAAEDPQGKAGLAHLVEHLSYTLRPNGPDSPTLGEQMNEVALHYNAYTNLDETHYTSIAFQDKLVSLLALESQRMQGRCEQFDDALIEREREVVRNEIRSRSSTGAASARLLYQKAYGPDHPYQGSIGGVDKDIVQITRDDVCDFFAQHYGPATAVLVVSGNVTVAQIQSAVGAVFGPIAKNRPAPRAKITKPKLRGTQSFHELPVKEATALIAFPAAPLRSDESVYEGLLVSTLRKRLFPLLGKHDYLTDVDIGILGGARAPLIVASVSVDNPNKLESAVERVFEISASFLDDLDEDTLLTMREHRRAKVLFAAEPFMREAVIFADYLQYTKHRDFITRDLSLLGKMRIEGMQGRAKALFTKQKSHVAYLYPNEDVVAVDERADVRFVSKDYDLRPWRAPVDIAEAEQSLVLPERGFSADVREYTLDNGLRVFLAPSMEAPVLDIRLVFAAGSLHEPPQSPGLSTLAAQLLDYRGPRRPTLAEYFTMTTVLKMGSDVSRYTDERTTTFRVTGMSMYADGLIWELHWLLESGAYDDDDLDKFRDFYKRRSDAEDGDDKQARVFLRTLLGSNHPYANAELTATGIENLSTADLQQFREQHYRINGATLIVSGQFDPFFMESEIKRLFGAWKAESAPARRQVPEAVRRRTTQYLAAVDDDQVQTRIVIGFDTQPGLREAHAQRLVLREIVREKMSSLRETLGATYGVQVQQVTREGPGVLFISASVDRERADAAFTAMNAALEAIRSGDFTADFVRARRTVVHNLFADTVDSNAVADELEFVATYGFSRNYYDKLAAQVAALRVGDLRALIDRELSAERQVVFVSGKRRSITNMYRAAGISQYRTIP